MTDPRAPQPTTPMPPDVHIARATLEHLLASEPGHPLAPAAAEALAVLTDVTPPYPPSTGQPATGDPVAAAVEHLHAAIDSATTVEELTRLGTAALILRRADADPGPAGTGPR